MVALLSRSNFVIKRRGSSCGKDSFEPQVRLTPLERGFETVNQPQFARMLLLPWRGMVAAVVVLVVVLVRPSSAAAAQVGE